MMGLDRSNDILGRGVLNGMDLTKCNRVGEMRCNEVNPSVAES